MRELRTKDSSRFGPSRAVGLTASLSVGGGAMEQGILRSNSLRRGFGK